MLHRGVVSPRSCEETPAVELTGWLPGEQSGSGGSHVPSLSHMPAGLPSRSHAPSPPDVRPCVSARGSASGGSHDRKGSCKGVQ